MTTGRINQVAIVHRKGPRPKSSDTVRRPRRDLEGSRRIVPSPSVFTHKMSCGVASYSTVKSSTSSGFNQHAQGVNSPAVSKALHSFVATLDSNLVTILI